MANALSQDPTDAYDPQAWQAEQQAIQRRQLMGQALMGQGFQQPQGQMVDGIYVAPSPLQGIANLAKTYFGNRMINQGNTNLGNLEKQRYAAMSGVLNNMPDNPTFKQQEQVAMELGEMSPQAAGTFNQTENFLRQKQLQQEMLKQQHQWEMWYAGHNPNAMKAVVNPKTQLPEYVPTTQAMGMQPWSPYMFMGGPSPFGSNVPAAGVSPQDAQAAAMTKVPPKFRGVVQAILQGRQQMPSGFALKTPYWNQVQQYVYGVNPKFDSTLFQRRQQTSNAFAHGVQAQQMKSINQALFHAGTLMQDIDKLDNYSGMATPLNAAKNWYESKTGNPAPKMFIETRNALANELRKVFAASGGGGLDELKQWEDSFNVNDSPQQQKANLMQGMHLLQGALFALKNQYETNMGSTAKFRTLISPRAQKMYDMVMNPGNATTTPSQPSQHNVIDFHNLK